MPRYVFITLVAVLSLVVGLYAWFRGADDDPGEVARRLRLQVERKPAETWHDARSRLNQFPEDERVFAAALYCAARAAPEKDWRQFVADHQTRIRSLTTADEPVWQRLQSDGYLLTLERLLAAALQTTPDDRQLLQAMGDLLLLEGRQQAARPFLRRLLQQNAISVEQLVFLCSRREMYEDQQVLQLAQEHEPGGPVMMGLAAIAFSQGDFDTSARYYRDAIEFLPDDPAAWQGLGLSLYRSGNPNDQLQHWREQVEGRQITGGDVCFLQGWLEEQQGDNAAAAQHFQAALRLVPWHRPASQALGSLWSREEQTRAAGVVMVTRAAKIHELELLMHAMLFGQREASEFARAAQLCGELGDAELALAWQGGAKAFGSSADMRELTREKLLSLAAAAKAEFLSALRFTADRTGDTPDTSRARVSVTAPSTPSVPAAPGSAVKFVDRSAELGLTASYYGGVRDFGNGLWIYQGFGGGVAVFDLDSDDRPDLYLTQACGWPVPATLPRAQQDLVYRNRRSGFEPVHERAVPPESGFGQGVAVGDWNSDGFDDLYVANIGANRLLINNGDGTFHELPIPDNDDWTSSCLLADLNGDGLDDLYDVCYLAGSQPFERICQSGDNTRTRSCLPSLFEPATDRIHLNQGDGTQVEVSVACGLEAAHGRGLGIVAADLDGQPGLELFVSNDLSANHFWQIQTDDTSLQLVEAAEIHGLARNGEGQLEACMGIAAADFSQSGEMDVIVTNFLNETNTFYESLGGGFFRDRSEASRLGRHSRSQLGFGTQAVDADLDGDFDVVITNGHVDDYSHLGAAFRMKLDVFENLGGSVFEKCPTGCAGDYGKQPVLGRAMARIDWNRDGRDDLAITHLDRPPALLENQSPASARFVSLKLIGVESNRPAIGARVSIKSGDEQIVLQQMAGDGYYCSNERRLQVGGFAEERLSEMSVRWPSGRLSVWRDVPTNERLVLVEGRDEVYSLRPSP